MTMDMNREDEVFHALSAMPGAVMQLYEAVDPVAYEIIMRTLKSWQEEQKYYARQEAKMEADLAREAQWEMEAEAATCWDEEQNIPDKE